MKSSLDYDEFIEKKIKKAQEYGFEPTAINAPLFEWQKQVVEWAIKKGRAAPITKSWARATKARPRGRKTQMGY